MKQLLVKLGDDEYHALERYCKITGRTKSAVVRCRIRVQVLNTAETSVESLRIPILRRNSTLRSVRHGVDGDLFVDVRSAVTISLRPRLIFTIKTKAKRNASL